MSIVSVTREEFLKDKQGRTFPDVLNEMREPFEEVLVFFNDENRQRRMEEAEIHHDRAPLAGVVRELESRPEINQYLSGVHAKRSQRLRQAIGVLVRIIMERRGWKKTGKKGSLGVRDDAAESSPPHNKGGLAFWFIRAERYQLSTGMPYRSVAQRCRDLQGTAAEPSTSSK